MSNSDKIKTLLVNAFGGTKKDWKRTLRKKLPNSNSTIQRNFNNKATGQEVKVLEVTDLADALNINTNIATSRIESAEDGAAFLLTETKAKLFETNVESDSDKAKIAQEAIRMMVNWEASDAWDEFQEKLKQAGSVAVANQFCFALDTKDGEPVWCINPIIYFEEEGYLRDQHNQHDNPVDFLQVQESTYEYKGNLKTKHEIANYLMSLGYVFDPKFQKFIDSNHSDLITAPSSLDNDPQP